ncbi:GGDEF domain-containing protein [Methylobacterium gregans]|uniref:diguanylate cyclase n=1 Tax=Methylobacterium gregans TaxID=374424 RepID=A0AA37HM37_9HYPH|nr:GGDEF domain-containing protein [Methylobacterium gregans]MDQ0521415.1 diguanylate cyclase (GGDEF)-like protein [Methylobacterium gregans]GJD78085.1 hypothetical protein NBEOAGPD_1297 [Methylobacterium gregans]GLS54579.1 GGDEF domain-containing protein [Methylobacterium gregans]
MQIDLATLWYLTIGTLLVSAALTLWERQAHPRRARELGIWAGACAVFALGCVVAMNRGLFPGAVGAALTNLLMVLGYLMVLHGAASLDGPARVRGSAAALAALALLWALAGWRFEAAFWNHVAALPIALTCGLTAWTLLRSRSVRGLRSRPVAVAVSAGHGLFYLLRGLVAPLLVERYGPGLLPVFAKVTMYEAVLYSVAMPMTFLALVREEAQAQLLAAARTDFLTGLANRQGFFERGTRMLAEREPDRPFALLAFDLDHFKSINDRYGHAAGDAVLALFARVAREAAGPDALVVRLGGEEFAALLPGQGARAARQVGEDIARLFAEAAAHRDGPGIRATVSVGLAEAGPDRGDLSGLLSAADRALYRAKAAGRNRLEVAAAA